uniref:tRNA ligase phosphodiesterase domain-containing protein n=1 Tax=Polytomella parva TaxID=51329 RepID=A0A7S0V1F6_9CHLO
MTFIKDGWRKEEGTGDYTRRSSVRDERQATVKEAVVVMADKNLVPSPMRNLNRVAGDLESCKLRSAATVAIIPTFKGKCSWDSHALTSKYYRTLSKYPFPLEQIALCMSRVLSRENHEGKLDPKACAKAMGVVAEFANFFKGYSMDSLIQELARAGFTKIQGLEVMRGDVDGKIVPPEVYELVAEGLLLTDASYSNRRSSSSSAPLPTASAWETKCRSLLASPTVKAALESLSLPVSLITKDLSGIIAAAFYAEKEAEAAGRKNVFLQTMMGEEEEKEETEDEDTVRLRRWGRFDSRQSNETERRRNGGGGGDRAGGGRGGRAEEAKKVSDKIWIRPNPIPVSPFIPPTVDPEIDGDAIAYLGVGGFDNRHLLDAVKAVLPADQAACLRTVPLHVTLWHRADSGMLNTSGLRDGLLRLGGWVQKCTLPNQPQVVGVSNDKSNPNANGSGNGAGAGEVVAQKIRLRVREILHSPGKVSAAIVESLEAIGNVGQKVELNLVKKKTGDVQDNNVANASASASTPSTSTSASTPTPSDSSSPSHWLKFNKFPHITVIVRKGYEPADSKDLLSKFQRNDPSVQKIALKQCVELYGRVLVNVQRRRGEQSTTF